MSRLDRLISEPCHIRGKWAVAGARPIYYASRRGNSSLDPGRLPGVDSGHPGRKAGPAQVRRRPPRDASSRTPGLSG